MVDVGYNLKYCGHQIIYNVKMTGNENGKVVFLSADGKEQYILEKENIEWIVPSGQYIPVIKDGIVVAYMDEDKYYHSKM